MAQQRMAVVVLGLWLAVPAVADEPVKGDAGSLNDMSMEVAALQVLYSFKATPDQMEKLRKMAGDTADKAPGRQTGKASDKFRKTLAELRQALAKNGDAQRIDDLFKEMNDLRDTEKPVLDDGVEITDEARGKAGEALRLFTVSQVAGYAGAYADDLPDPRQRTLEALAKARGLDASAWKELRDSVSDEVGRLVGGLDNDEAGAVSDKVIQLLIVARTLKDEEFKKQRPELEAKIREIVGDIGPTDVLRHLLEHTLAELLSNPRLPAAIDARR